jgi:ABC-2 type transport system ATP-binding protein
VRDTIADLELPLNRMEHRRHHVEELFSAAPQSIGPESTAPQFTPPQIAEARP